MTRPVRRTLLALLLFAPLSGLVACAPSTDVGDDDSAHTSTAVIEAPEGYADEIETWRAERADSLRSEDGWLSLVGLHWLQEGESTIGSGEGNDLVFPENAPEELATVTLDGGTVTLTPAEGSGLALSPPEPSGEEEEEAAETADAEPLPAGEPIELAPDVSGEPTVLEVGSLIFYVIERGGRYGLRVKDPEGPARTNFEGLEFYETDPAWRVEARLEREEGATVAIPNVLGQVEDVRAPGVLVFTAPDGGEYRLTPMQGEPGQDLFVVFGDRTNGRGTYGGGRFLYAEAPAEGSDWVLLDFNRSYNPPCAFTPYATCPLPPQENKLKADIRAGEKAYAGEVPH